MLRAPLATVILSVVIWSVALDVVAVTSFKFATKTPLPHTASTFTTAWDQWDAGWYGAIAAYGYKGPRDAQKGGAYLEGGFYPGYPLLARGVYEVVQVAGVSLVGAMLITNQLLVFAVAILLYLLARELTGSTETAVRTVQCLLVFPFAYFLLAPYSESLFLTGIAGFAWALKTRRYGLAAAFGAVASATRVTGVILPAIMAVGYLEQHEWRWRSITPRIALWIVTPIAGAAAFAIYEWSVFGSPTYYEHIQNIGFGHVYSLNLVHTITSAFGAQYLTAGQLLGVPLEVFVNLPLLVAFAFLSWIVWRRFGAALGLMCGLLILAPLTGGQTVSLNRYLLPCLPAFVVLAGWTLEHRWFDFAYRTVGCILLGLFLVMFTHGVWTG